MAKLDAITQATVDEVVAHNLLKNIRVGELHDNPQTHQQIHPVIRLYVKALISVGKKSKPLPRQAKTG